MERAWQARRSGFPGTIEFIVPRRTLAVSVTGKSCALNCAHCSGVYLHSMASIKKALNQPGGQTRSYLVSGGSDSQGRVPLLKHWPELKLLAERGPLNLHAGLVSEKEARRLGEIATVVSFDLVGDNETIAAVYGLKAGVDDYLQAYRHLQKYTRVVPHICIGLNGGKIKGEYEALHLLSKEKVEAISMIVFRPTKGTPLSDCPPPGPEEVARFLATARLTFPHTPLYLGCMRPGGRYREQLDTYAVRAGINKIVLPAPAARQQAIQMGLTISFSEECCAL